jgi:hypothetical protein
MKPQFEKVTLVRDNTNEQVIDLSGPIDLEGTEEDLYIWVMLHQDAPPDGEHGAFEQGTAAFEANDVKTLIADARNNFHAAVAKSQAPITSRTTTDDLQGLVLAGTPRWFATIEAKPGTFYKGEVRAEAVAIVRAPGRMNRIVWWDDVAELKSEPNDAEGSSAKTGISN